jgi:hypothetical protein
VLLPLDDQRAAVATQQGLHGIGELEGAGLYTALGLRRHDQLNL